jgi:hypothetical protein
VANIGFSLALVFFILSTELEIRWNHINGVQSLRGTGQLLPMIVAGGALVRVVWKFLLKLGTSDVKAQLQTASEQRSPAIQLGMLNTTTASTSTGGHSST